MDLNFPVNYPVFFNSSKSNELAVQRFAVLFNGFRVRCSYSCNCPISRTTLPVHDRSLSVNDTLKKMEFSPDLGQLKTVY